MRIVRINEACQSTLTYNLMQEGKQSHARRCPNSALRMLRQEDWV